MGFEQRLNRNLSKCAR